MSSETGCCEPEGVDVVEIPYDLLILLATVKSNNNLQI